MVNQDPFQGHDLLRTFVTSPNQLNLELPGLTRCTKPSCIASFDRAEAIEAPMSDISFRHPLIWPFW